jgi:hypothetical protein
MRRIKIDQLRQADGSIHHVAEVGCAIEPCAKVFPEGTSPETCDYLHTDGVDGDGSLIWCCNKPSCTGGD